MDSWPEEMRGGETRKGEAKNINGNSRNTKRTEQSNNKQTVIERGWKLATVVGNLAPNLYSPPPPHPYLGWYTSKLYTYANSFYAGCALNQYARYRKIHYLRWNKFHSTPGPNGKLDSKQLPWYMVDNHDTCDGQHGCRRRLHVGNDHSLNLFFAPTGVSGFTYAVFVPSSPKLTLFPAYSLSGLRSFYLRPMGRAQ